MNLACVVLVDTGLALVAVGAVSLVKPLQLLFVSSRPAGSAVLALGLLVLAFGLLLPAGLEHLPAPPTKLDEIVPEYQFGELHETRVHAPAAATYSAIRPVTAGEIRFFRLLTWIRSPRLGAGGESILNAPAEKPLLDVALRSGFFLVAEDPGRELIVGTLVCCHGPKPRSGADLVARSEPGLAKAFMSFRVDGEDGGWTRLSTQTRVFANDDDSRRRFALYWRTIYPGSAFIRRMWLAAIKGRAEAGGR